jgi:hypothetical protein
VKWAATGLSRAGGEQAGVSRGPETVTQLFALLMAWRAWFKLTSKSFEQLGDEALPAEVLSKLKGMIGRPFRTEKELLAELGQALTPEELHRRQAALVRRAARPREADHDGGGLNTLGQLLLGRVRDARGAVHLNLAS